MPSNERKLNYALFAMAAPGTAAAVWALYNFPVDKLGGGLIALSLVTIFSGSYLRIDLPRTKLHLTVSDALIFLSMLFYGGGVAVVLSMLEAGYSSLRLADGRPDKRFASTRTIAINVLIAGVSTFATALVTGAMFTSGEALLDAGLNTELRFMLAAMAISQFLFNTVLVSGYIALRSGRKMLDVWSEHSLGALTMFCGGALMAGLSAKAVKQTDMSLFALAIGFFSLMFVTYKRYANDVRKASSEAERSEAARVQDAEAHIAELKHYVDELTRATEQLTESKESYRHAAFHDPLSGLPNRSHVIATINELIKASPGGERDLAVLLVNLNRFRTINESLGYQTGDRVIKHLAKRMTEMVRPGDMVGHFGGDQFAIVVSGISDTGQVTAFAEALAKKAAEAIVFKGRQVYTTASIGIAFREAGHIKAEEMLRDSDIAMYIAKDGRKSWSVFDRSMRANAVSRQQLETDLRYAIVCNELEIYYQPIVEIGTMRLYGFEALVRWNHPQKGLILPGEFVELSEDTGLVIPMTLQILKSACAQTVEWQERGPNNQRLAVSVNLSGKHFAEPALVEQVAGIITETRIEPSCLKLEITESSTMDNAESAIEKLNELRSAGVKLSIDDFGTGYSSLSYLRRFPVNTLKIDRSFVTGIEESGESDEIVRTIMALANSLHLDVVAEGIESVQQLNHLRSLGCQYGQGYLFSRPLPAAAAEALVDEPDTWKHLLDNAVAGEPVETDFSGSTFAS